MICSVQTADEEQSQNQNNTYRQIAPEIRIFHNRKIDHVYYLAVKSIRIFNYQW